MAQKMGIGQDKIQQALSMANNYSNDINGLKKVINDNGGKAFLDKALNFADNPLAKIALNKLGITSEVIDGLKKDLGVNGVSTPYSNSNDILARLKHLK